MKKKLFKKTGLIATAALAFPLTLGSTILMTGCSQTKGDPQELVPHDKESWKHAIEHMASCGHPTIFLTTEAVYELQQAANLYFAASQLAMSQNHTYKNDNFKLNDFIFCVSYSSWHYKTATPSSSEGKFALNYNYLVDKTFGYVDILKEGLKAKNIDLSKGNHMLVSNLQDFNLHLDDYNSSLSDFEGYNGWDISFNIVDRIMSLYEQVNPDIKFNFVITDFSWDHCLNDSRDKDNIAKAIIRMYRKCDRIYLISDGAWTWRTGNKNFKKHFQEYGYTSIDDQEKLWNKIVTSRDDVAIEALRTNPYVFLNNENHYYNFGPSTTASFAPDNLDPRYNLTKETTYKFTAPWLATNSYHQILPTDNFYLYEFSYLKFFKYRDLDFRFSDLFIANTKNNFKSSKKNLIWMLPKALAIESKPSEQVLKTCQNILKKVKENYPLNQWNYIIKAHPQLSGDQVANSIKKLFDSEQIPDNVCIIDPIYPFEYAVTLDWYMVENGMETNYHLIDPNTLDDEHPSGIMTGFDISTTGIYAVMSMLVNEYGFKFSQLKNLVKNDCFFIPRKIGIPGYVSQEGKDYVSDNKNDLKLFYLPLIQNDEFPDVINFEIFDN